MFMIIIWVISVIGILFIITDLQLSLPSQLHSHSTTHLRKCLSRSQSKKVSDQNDAYDCDVNCRLRVKLVAILPGQHHRHHPGYEYVNTFRGRSPGFTRQSLCNLQPHSVHGDEWQISSNSPTHHPLQQLFLKGGQANVGFRFQVSRVHYRQCQFFFWKKKIAEIPERSFLGVCIVLQCG